MRGDPGYTIIETLVALAILSVSLIAFYSVGGTSLRSIGHVRRVDHAILLAQSKLDEVAMTRGSLAAKASGVFAGTDYAWSISATTLRRDAPRPGALQLQDVTIEISWLEGLNAQSVSVQTRHLGRGEP